MEFNLLHVMWILYSFVVTFLGIFVLYCDKWMPRTIIRAFKFGKTGKDLSRIKSFFHYFEVPKRWFTHFYIFGSLYFLYITMAVLIRYFVGYSDPFLHHLLDIFTDKNRKSTVDAEDVTILCILILFQVWRRCYECLYISVYSDSKMNVIHYFVGLTFYFGVGLSLLYEAPYFQNHTDELPKDQHFTSWLSFNHVIGTILFSLAFMLQYQSHVRLANLRKDSRGNAVVTLKHLMPTGGWFEYVSCPHYFAEIVMYLSGSLIFRGQNNTWWLVCLWTVMNQIIAGLLSHQWYKKTFKNYPSSRKAVIPFLL